MFGKFMNNEYNIIKVFKKPNIKLRKVYTLENHRCKIKT